MLATQRDDRCIYEGSLFVDGEIRRTRSDIDCHDTELTLATREHRFTTREDIGIRIHNLYTHIMDSFMDIRERISTDRYYMTADIEFFPTHADGVFDPVFEIERKALWDHFEHSTVHEIDTILTYI